MTRVFNGVYSYRAGSHKPAPVFIPTKYWVCECGRKYTSKGVNFMTDDNFPMPISIKDNKCICGKSLSPQDKSKEGTHE